MKPTESLLVAPHLEMGDAIVSNGICRTLAKSEKKIVWLSRHDYTVAVRRMFADLPNVQVLPVLSYEEVRNRWLPVWPRTVKLGYFAKDFDCSKWDSEFYRQAGYSFDNRWTEFALPPALLPQGVTKQPFALVHEDHPRQFLVDPNRLPKDIEVRYITRRASFWDWVPDILAAQELHFIDSAFLNLAESLWGLKLLNSTKLVFHKYAKRYPVNGGLWPQLRGPWEVLT
jgi:hypothetical protein